MGPTTISLADRVQQSLSGNRVARKEMPCHGHVCLRVKAAIKTLMGHNVCPILYTSCSDVFLSDKKIFELILRILKIIKEYSRNISIISFQ